MTRFLFDADSIIDFLYGVPTTVALLQQLEAQGHQLCTCDVVVAEVSAGLLPQHRAAGERLLAAFEYQPTPRLAAQQAGEWRAAYRSRGVQLATTDCLIAAVAHAHDAQLVTANLRDFPMPEVTLLPLPRTQGGTT